MAAVAAEVEVVGAQQIGLAHSGGLLAQGQVSGAGIGDLNAVIAALGLDLVEHGLKLPQDGDVPPDTHQVVVRKLAALALVGNGSVVYVDRDIRKGDLARGAGCRGIHINTLRHSL